MLLENKLERVVNESSSNVDDECIHMEADDPAMPGLTLRMWVIGIAFTLLGCSLNTLYTLRFPSISLTQSAVQFLAFPVGKIWERVIPEWTLSILGWKLRLNPGPFNQKENILIYVMANLSFLTRLSADVLTEQRVFFGYETGWGFELMITLATVLYGFSIAGICKSIVVDPSSMLWPGVFANTALNDALHSSKDKPESVHRYRMSRYSFFLIAFSISFCWYWFPDFIFPALSYFTFVCWAAPNNAVVNQIFGMNSGLGLLPVTFDWSQIAYIGSPLVVPSWAIANSNLVYDNTGKAYNISRVINKHDGYQLDSVRYQEYSSIYLPVTYALNQFGLAFATIVSLFIWLLLEKRNQIWDAVSKIKHAHRKRATNQKTTGSSVLETPIWWYWVTATVSLFLAIFCCEYWKVQLPWYGVLLAFAVSTVFFVPLGIIYGTTNLRINIDVFCRIIAGYIWEGRVLANIWFFNLGYISGIKALQFSQDFKLGLYCGIPPRQLFIVQLVAICVATLAQVGVLNWALTNISGVCTKEAVNGFTCPFSRTHFNTSTIWGAVGPRRFFSTDSTYHSLLYFFILGLVLPVVVYGLKRRFPNSFWRHAHVPLLLGGLNFLPPASGTNYGSWTIVGLAAGVLIKRKYTVWWKRYVFVLSTALDSSIAIAAVIIFFAVFWSKASDHFSWWGTKVYQDTCDWKSCPFKILEPGRKFGP
ncbi:OPT oligopeptide transporter protein-domain-containing protein [Boeremia exigua]|uniref:OPT oligopeptide transporter protein-domain-containing protein n=1 Tax=Boeremia exigua TaxID=749465 RepID=UPI001E8D5359|nr:OPT oligopeptide transporter protein-domain-containing protein [Boeremia exigua]KAH6642047.1 OPT oligopeptide transporter protein-domain-containing protein [Boeremia exigua]